MRRFLETLSSKTGILVMELMQVLILWVLALWLLAPQDCLAQGIPVYDNTNFLQNVVTAAQSTITAAQTTLTVKNQLIDLLPLDAVIAAEGIAEDAAALTDIISQAEGLSYDIRSLEAQFAALFALDGAPRSSSALAERLAQVRAVRSQAYAYAMRTQTLLLTVQRTATHLLQLIESIGAFAGAKQGQQTAVQVQSSVAKTLLVLETQTAAFQRAQSLDKAEEVLIMESLQHINEGVMADWPTRK